MWPHGHCCLSVLGNTCFFNKILKQSEQPLRVYQTAAARFTNFCQSTLTLFVFWILTDYSDRSFSFNDLAFFADRLYRWSYFHWKSSFRKFIKICSFLSAQIQYTHAFGLYIITAKYKMQALFWIKSHFFIFSPIFPNHPSIRTGFNICSGTCLKNHFPNQHVKDIWRRISLSDKMNQYVLFMRMAIDLLPDK